MTMTHQTNAQRLADELDVVHNGHADEGPSTFSEAAIELRRLSAIEQERDQLRAQLAALKDGQAGGEVVAYLYQCRKKPELKELRFNARCLGLESMGYKAHALTLATPKPVPMTDDEMWELWNAQGIDDMNQQEAITFARAIEAHHGISEVQG